MELANAEDFAFSLFEPVGLQYVAWRPVLIQQGDKTLLFWLLVIVNADANTLTTLLLVAEQDR